jgi:hypothetical protein
MEGRVGIVLELPRQKPTMRVGKLTRLLHHAGPFVRGWG